MEETDWRLFKINKIINYLYREEQMASLLPLEFDARGFHVSIYFNFDSECFEQIDGKGKMEQFDSRFHGRGYTHTFCR